MVPGTRPIAADQVPIGVSAPVTAASRTQAGFSSVFPHKLAVGNNPARRTAFSADKPVARKIVVVGRPVARKIAAVGKPVARKIVVVGKSVDLLIAVVGTLGIVVVAAAVVVVDIVAAHKPGVGILADMIVEVHDGRVLVGAQEQTATPVVWIVCWSLVEEERLASLAHERWL